MDKRQTLKIVIEGDASGLRKELKRLRKDIKKAEKDAARLEHRLARIANQSAGRIPGNTD